MSFKPADGEFDKEMRKGGGEGGHSRIIGGRQHCIGRGICLNANFSLPCTCTYRCSGVHRACTCKMYLEVAGVEARALALPPVERKYHDDFAAAVPATADMQWRGLL